MTQEEVLGFLRQNPGWHTVRDLTEALGRNKTTMARCLRSLSKTDFIVLKRSKLEGINRLSYLVMAPEV